MLQIFYNSTNLTLQMQYFYKLLPHLFTNTLHLPCCLYSERSKEDALPSSVMPSSIRVTSITSALRCETMRHKYTGSYQQSLTNSFFVPAHVAQENICASLQIDNHWHTHFDTNSVEFVVDKCLGEEENVIM